MSKGILSFISVLFILLIIGSSFSIFNSADGIVPAWTNWLAIANNKCVGELVDNNFTFPLWGEGRARVPNEEAIIFMQLEVESPFNSTDVGVLIFTRNVSALRFDILIKAPLDVPSGEYYVQVHGRYGSDPSNLNHTMDPASAILIIPQIYSWDIECQKSVEITAGKKTEVPLNISNLGNGLDKIRLKIMNLDDFKEMGWDLQLSPDIVHMPENSSRHIPMFIDIPDEHSSGSYKIVIKYNSTIEDHLGIYQEDGRLTMTIEVLNDYKDEVKFGLMIMAPVLLLYLLILVAIDLVRRHKK